METRATLAASLLGRTLLLGILGWAFVEGEVESPALSAGAVLLAALASLAALPPGGGRWRAAETVRFVPFFLLRSVQGGVDVARRALHPRLPILPGALVYPLRLPEGSVRVFFVVVLCLVPGTLSVRLEGDSLRVHLLHRGVPARERIEELEERVAALFGLRLREP